MSTTEKPVRELLCEKCGDRVAVSYVNPGPGEPMNLASDWGCMSDTPVGEFGEPICKCGEPMTFSMIRVRGIP